MLNAFLEMKRTIVSYQVLKSLQDNLDGTVSND